jgi:hypothetical protein
MPPFLADLANGQKKRKIPSLPDGCSGVPFPKKLRDFSSPYSYNK